MERDYFINFLTYHIHTVLLTAVIFIIPGVIAARSYIAMKRLRERCTERVQAVCIGTDIRHSTGRGVGRYMRATYEYCYNGRYYTGCSNVEYNIGFIDGFEPIRRGESTELWIDPYALPNTFFDPIAKKKMYKWRYGVIFCISMIIITAIPYINLLFLKFS